MPEPSDAHLLQAYLRGDRAAFDALFRRYSARIHATALRMTGRWEDAEDVLQDTFLRLSQKASSLRRSGSLAAWLYRTAVNRSTDLLRARKKMVSLDGEGAEASTVVAVLSLRHEAERAERNRREELLRHVETLVPRLPARQAAVFVLRRFQGLTHREISEVLGCTEAASRSNHSLACKALRAWVAEAAAAELAAAGESRAIGEEGP